MIDKKQPCYVAYVPHGINQKYFYVVDKTNTDLLNFKNKLFKGDEVKLAFLYNNRNIRRKMTSDIILAFKLFLDKEVDKSGIVLVMHTQPTDENGTDLVAVIKALCPEYANRIIFTNAKLSPVEMNLLYNSCDVVINVGSNEGWGLSSTEAMMTGRVLINNVTGGLQDQCRFEDDEGNWIEFSSEFASNHCGKYKTHGAWVKPIYPSAINLQGSIPTPYIFDDRADVRDIALAMKYWFDMQPCDREAAGAEGRDWVISDESKMTAAKMAESFMTNCDLVLENWAPPKRFKILNAQACIEQDKHKLTGIELSL